MSYRDWHVGMKVVCIDDAWENEHTRPGFAYPRRGQVYTIGAIAAEVMLYGIRYNGPWIGVQEVGGNWGGRPEFSASCFRPVQPRKTDISIFTRMLTDTREVVDA
jgi:hypothetical protein